MRAIITKAAILGVALAVSACSPKTETATDNAMVTDMNATDTMDTMSDNMTATDGAMAADNGAMMANDSMDAMASNAQ